MPPFSQVWPFNGGGMGGTTSIPYIINLWGRSSQLNLRNTNIGCTTIFAQASALGYRDGRNAIAS